MTELSYMLRGSLNTGWSDRVMPGFLDNVLHQRMDDRKGPFQLCRIANTDGDSVDCGPWRTLQDARETFAARIIGESHADTLWEITSQEKSEWWLRVRAKAYPLGERVIDAALTQLGVPYRLGSATPGELFDCSGLTMWAWASVGVELPHNAEQQRQSTPKVADPIPGDLVLFDYNSPLGGAASHVGLWLREGTLIDTRNPTDSPVGIRAIEPPPYLLGFHRPS